jgi:hypothetical protein
MDDHPPPSKRGSFPQDPRSRRPVLQLPLSQQELWLEIVALLGLLLMLILLAWGWLTLKSSIPIHYSPRGEPDSYGGKEALLLFPVLSLLLYSTISVFSRFPHHWNYPWLITQENASRHYRLARTMLYRIKLQLCWLFTYIEWMIIQSAREQHLRFIFLVGIFSILLLMLATVMRYFIVAEQI